MKTYSSNSTDTCNKDRTPFPPTGGDCADSRVNTTVNNAALNCYECDQINGKCKTGRCSKKYCVKSVAHVQGTWATKKFCSDVNPFGINEVCSSHDLTVSVSNINAIGGRSEICFCKDRQNCNSAAKTGLFLTFIFFFGKIFVKTIWIFRSINNQTCNLFIGRNKYWVATSFASRIF